MPREQGGQGETLPEFFNLLIELSAANSNISQALRAHFGFTEDILNSKSAQRQKVWLERIEHGETVGSAWSRLATQRGSIASR